MAVSLQLDVAMRDRKVVNDSVCWERDGRWHLPTLAAKLCTASDTGVLLVFADLHEHCTSSDKQ